MRLSQHLSRPLHGLIYVGRKLSQHLSRPLHGLIYVGTRLSQPMSRLLRDTNAHLNCFLCRSY